MNRAQKRGLCLLLSFWIFCLLWTRWPLFEKKPVSPVFADLVLEPLTLPEKILFGFPLSINQLSAREWEMLPRVGPKLAQRIVDYRLQHGPFQNSEALLEVKGMGPKTLESLRHFLKE